VISRGLPTKKILYYTKKFSRNTGTCITQKKRYIHITKMSDMAITVIDCSVIFVCIKKKWN